MEKKTTNQGPDPNIIGIIGLVIAGILGSLLFAGLEAGTSVSFALLGAVIFAVLYFGGRWLVTRPISTKLETTRWGGMDLGTKLIMAGIALILLGTGLGGRFLITAPGLGLILLVLFIYWLLMKKKK